MKAIISSVFRVMCLPYEDRIMTIDQLLFDNYSSSTSLSPTIPTIDSSQQTTDNVGVGMYPSLMGTFNISKPILAINSAPSGVSSPFSPVSFHTMYLDEL